MLVNVAVRNVIVGVMSRQSVALWAPGWNKIVHVVLAAAGVAKASRKVLVVVARMPVVYRWGTPRRSAAEGGR